MKEAVAKYRARMVINRYKSYADFSKHASKSEKKTVVKGTVLKANKLQRQTAGLE